MFITFIPVFKIPVEVILHFNICLRYSIFNMKYCLSVCLYVCLSVCLSGYFVVCLLVCSYFYSYLFNYFIFVYTSFSLCLFNFPTLCGDWVCFLFIYYGLQFCAPIVICFLFCSHFLISYLVITNYVSFNIKFCHCDVIY